MDYSLNALYEAAGKTKQAVWEHFKREEALLVLIRSLIERVDKRRAEHPGVGLEALYWQLRPEGIGRDKFCAIFGQLGYKLRPPRNRTRTTIPAHKAYQNLIAGRLVSGPCQVWQSDITYFKIGERFYYLTFIIDVYTRRIVGYAVSKTLRAEANLRALQMAVSQYSAEQLAGLVHHSDRGSQYTDGRYLALLRRHGMLISMSRRAQDNAYAERINGIIKNEYLIHWALSSYQQLRRATQKAVTDYNTKRHHGELERQTPAAFEQAYDRPNNAPFKAWVMQDEHTPKAALQKTIDRHIPYAYCAYNMN
jgi:transposase InsO family protein